MGERRNRDDFAEINLDRTPLASSLPTNHFDTKENLHHRMSRLASLRGPSTPSPASARASPPLSPTSPTTRLSALDPTSYHRKIRAILVEFEKAIKDWEEVVLMDGLKAGKACVDARTELE